MTERVNSRVGQIPSPAGGGGLGWGQADPA